MVETPLIRQLQMIAEYALDVPEPSGVAFSKSLNCLWTVSDQTNKIYKLSLIGTTLETLSFTGQDLEGVTYDSISQTLWVVQESTREIVQVDLSGQELHRYTVSVNGSTPNSGLEGVCIDQNQLISVVNEKDPGVFVSLDSNYTVVSTQTLNFASDYADVCVNPESPGCYWIVSDEDQELYNWNITEGILESFPLNFPKPEGIAYDITSHRLYLVSDSQSKLYLYEIKNPTN